MGELIADIEKAFDYRGDVTLTLKDGKSVVGFLSNREPKGTSRCREPFVEMMIAGNDEKQLVKYAEISRVEFSLLTTKTLARRLGEGTKAVLACLDEGHKLIDTVSVECIRFRQDGRAQTVFHEELV